VLERVGHLLVPVHRDTLHQMRPDAGFKLRQISLKETFKLWFACSGPATQFVYEILIARIFN
jgi:hypothetical protein